MAPSRRYDISLAPDPVIEAYKKDVDRTLLRENLKLTPEERLQKLLDLQALADSMLATNAPKGFAFRPDPDTLKACRGMSAEDKLRWLEEANEFVRRFVPPERLEQWERIRRGQDGNAQETP